jgi:hypothetical protein
MDQGDLCLPQASPTITGQNNHPKQPTRKGIAERCSPFTHLPLRTVLAAPLPLLFLSITASPKLPNIRQPLAPLAASFHFLSTTLSLKLAALSQIPQQIHHRLFSQRPRNDPQKNRSASTSQRTPPKTPPRRILHINVDKDRSAKPTTVLSQNLLNFFIFPVLTAEDVPLQKGSDPQGLETGQKTQDETAKITTVEKVEEGEGTAVSFSDPDAGQLQHARPIAQDDADQNATADLAQRTHRSQLHTQTLPLLPKTHASPKQAQRQRQDSPGPKKLSQTNQMILSFLPALPFPRLLVVSEARL